MALAPSRYSLIAKRDRRLHAGNFPVVADGRLSSFHYAKHLRGHAQGIVGGRAADIELGLDDLLDHNVTGYDAGNAILRAHGTTAWSSAATIFQSAAMTSWWFGTYFWPELVEALHRSFLPKVSRRWSGLNWICICRPFPSGLYATKTCLRMLAFAASRIL